MAPKIKDPLRSSDTENRLVVAKGEARWRRDGLGVWN